MVELFFERTGQERRVGDIYKGNVEAVLPGLQASFVNIGMEKRAFLHVSDVVEGLFDYEDIVGERKVEKKKIPSSIDEILKVGQEILVQISKEPIGNKGCRVTSQLSLAGRYCVLVPNNSQIGVSRRIEDIHEKRRLKSIVSELMKKSSFEVNAGIIVRTAAQGKGKRDLKLDISNLITTYKKILRKANRTRAPALVYKEMGLIGSLIRDLFTEKINTLIIDSKREYREIQYYLRNVAPELKTRVKLYNEKIPIFEAYEVEEQIERALQRKVWLKKGGYILIDQTEALTAVDVNTGKFVGKNNPEQTIFETNIEAAREIARQIRLRDLGGIIVIDFIDMESKENKRKVIETLRDGFNNDKARTKVFEIGPLGLVEMTRKRVRPSLWHTFCEPCLACDGSGRVLSRATVTMNIERWIKKFGERLKGSRIEIQVHPVVSLYLKEDEAKNLEQFEKDFEMKLSIREDCSLPIDKFKIFSLDTNMEVNEEFFS